MLIRRVKPCVLTLENEPVLDFDELMLGRVSWSSEPVFVAACFTRGTEVEVTQEQVNALRVIGDDRWQVADDVCQRSGIEARVLEELVEIGLVLEGDPRDDSNETWGPFNALEAWNKYAVLYHYMNRWEGTNLHLQLPKEQGRVGEIMSVSEEMWKEFLHNNGEPPPTFKTLIQPVSTHDLPIPRAPRGELFETLAKRKTTRAFDPKIAINIEDFSTLVYQSFGCHGYSPVYKDIVGLKKTSPSGGDLHPVEVYPLVMNVETLAPGLYHYNVQNHRLDAIRQFDEARARDLANVFTAGQSYPQWCGVLFLLTARFYRNHWKYRGHGRAYSVLCMDAAHLSQTHYMVAAKLGLGAFFTAAINGKDVEAELGIDGFAEGALAACGAGHFSATESIDPEFFSYTPRTTMF